MASPLEAAYEFDLSGGMLCLDFANTVSHRKIPQRLADHLQNYPELVSFAAQSKLLSPSQCEALLLHARRHSSDANRVLRQAIVLREALYRLFSTIVAGGAPAEDDLVRTSQFAVEALRHRKLVRVNGSYRWQWEGNQRGLERILWPVAQSAAELLTSEKLATVRLCEAPDCDWLFLDRSRNRSRRWCDMTSCGNRQKARRHYHRAKK
jgi:predicted RNA-binding Zn ribbon-like protein